LCTSHFAKLCKWPTFCNTPTTFTSRVSTKGLLDLGFLCDKMLKTWEHLWQIYTRRAWGWIECSFYPSNNPRKIISIHNNVLWDW
jgi:hypothetical protein